MNQQHIVLGIDPATVTGWCAGPDFYGEWKLKKYNEKIPEGAKWSRYYKKLEELNNICRFTAIAIERPAGRNIRSVILHAKLIGITQLFCWKHNIEILEFSAKQIKKHATGNGNASKDAMIIAATRKFGYQGKSNNEADALWIYEYANKVLDGEL